jgi:hypothetical protein
MLNSDNGMYLWIMEYSSSRFPKQIRNITILRICGEMQNHYNRTNTKEKKTEWLKTIIQP